MLVEQVVQRGPTDTELGRRAADVALRPDQRIDHDLPLDPVARLAQRRTLRSRSRGDPEVGRLDEARPHQDRRSLDGILELSHVAGPGALGHRGDSLAPDREPPPGWMTLLATKAWREHEDVRRAHVRRR